MKIKRIWTLEKVRSMCIKENLYTCGENKSYSKMLIFVSRHEPTDENILRVAKDIFDNSENIELQDVIFLLLNETILYTIEDIGDIPKPNLWKRH